MTQTNTKSILSAALLTVSSSVVSLPLGDDRVETESVVNISSGEAWKESEHASINDILGAKLKIKKGMQFSIVADAYVEQMEMLNASGEIEDEREYTVNQFYYSQRIGNRIKLSAGRQRILWGHGFAFIPTDFVNPPLDPSRLDLENAKGVDSLSIDYFFKSNSFTFLVNESALEEGDSGYGVKWTNSQFSSVDFNMVLYDSPETGNAFGVSLATDPLRWLYENSKGQLNATMGIAIKEFTQYRRVTSEEVNSGGNSISCPNLGDRKQDKDHYLSGTFGLSYEWVDSRITLRSESYYLQEAYDGDELQSLYHSATSLCAQETDLIQNLSTLVPARTQRYYSVLSLGQDPVTEGTGNRFTDNLAYGIGYTLGKDNSELLTLSLTSRYFDFAEFSLDFVYPRGDAETEFGFFPFDKIITVSMKFAFL